MVRKLVLILATSAAVSGAAFNPAMASGDEYGYGPGADIRSDLRDIQRDRTDFRRDFRDMHRDLWAGRYGEAQRDLADVERDRRDLRRNRRDLFWDRRGY
jgi:hypothetical protein